MRGKWHVDGEEVVDKEWEGRQICNGVGRADRDQIGGSFGGSGAHRNLNPFLASIHLPRSMWTCSSNIMAPVQVDPVGWHRLTPGQIE